MNSKIERFAVLVHEKRKEKNLSQSKLAELTGLSLRSIQRIENAEVQPREYSKNVLAEVLEFSEETNFENKETFKSSLPKKVILSLSSAICIPLLALAFIAQSATFPETQFENYIFWFFIILLLTSFQWGIWLNWKKST